MSVPGTPHGGDVVGEEVVEAGGSGAFEGDDDAAIAGADVGAGGGYCGIAVAVGGAGEGDVYLDGWTDEQDDSGNQQCEQAVAQH